MDRTDEWRVFTAVAARLSFSRAARELGRSPQAVTRAIAALEARLGTRLLHRTTRAVSLSSDGERYLERSRRALAELDALEAAVPAELTGTLHVTAPVLFGQLHVAPIVRELLAAHPGISARLVLVDRIVALADEGIDVGVRIGALPDSALRARVVGHVRHVVVASPAYLVRAGTPRAPAALAHHACITSGATSERWAFADRGVTVRARLAVTTAQAAIDAALADFGLARVLSYQVEHLVAARQLRGVLAAFAPAPVPVHLVHLPGVQSRVAAAFVELAARRLTAGSRSSSSRRPSR
jgi:DNA-binding transcriptional LysR family regulator